MGGQVLDGDILSDEREDTRPFEGVRTRRVMAFVVDYLIVALLVTGAGIVVFLLGLLTFGIAWGLFGILAPLVAAVYVWTTLGGPSQSTLGMRAMSVRLERLDGRPIDGLTAVVHTVLFWAGNVLLTPFILLATLFTDSKRTLHDLLLGTVVVRSDR